jgi:hypothetical protein
VEAFEEDGAAPALLLPRARSGLAQRSLRTRRAHPQSGVGEHPTRRRCAAAPPLPSRNAPQAPAAGSRRRSCCCSFLHEQAGLVEPVLLRERTQPAGRVAGKPTVWVSLWGTLSQAASRLEVDERGARQSRVHAALEPCTVGGETGNPQQRSGAQGVAGPGRAKEGWPCGQGLCSPSAPPWVALDTRCSGA